MSLVLSENDWDTLLKEAYSLDNPTGPARLLTALSGRENPFECDDESERNELREAHQADLAAIYHYRHAGHALVEEDREVWLDRLAWLLRTLEAYQLQRPSTAILVAVLRVASAFASDVPIWQRLPSKYLSDNLFASMEALIGSTACSINAPGQPAPIWEREAVQHFLQADADGDWPAIENAWRTIVPAIMPDGLLAEATACLCVEERGHRVLASALDSCTSILPVVKAAQAMKPEQIGKVAVHATSTRARFALIQSLAFNQPRNEPLQVATLEDLAKVFQEVQKDEAAWLKWMLALNRYPVRTQSMQPAFGRSLVGSSEKAKEAYIGAISLRTTPNECREAVTLCLSEFREKASCEERQEMWQLAFQRWEEWDFDGNSRNIPLTAIAVSDLDFALIGYGVECLSDQNLQAKLQCLAGELTAVQSNWYSDRIAFDAGWYRALSRWQIFAYAAEVRAGQQKWQIPQIVLLPFDPKSMRYLAMTLSTNLPNGLRTR